MNATHRRSLDLCDELVTILAERGETSLGDLATLLNSSTNSLSQSRMLYNLRLSSARAPHRILTRRQGRRVHWFLKPINDPNPISTEN